MKKEQKEEMNLSHHPCRRRDISSFVQEQVPALPRRAKRESLRLESGFTPELVGFAIACRVLSRNNAVRRMRDGHPGYVLRR